jgi:hypothetical protein
MAWQMPPKTKTASGAERRCGIEIEYIDVPLARSAQLIAGLWQGDIRWQHDHHATIATPQLGEFTVELDVEWMQKLAQEAQQQEAAQQLPLAKTADKMLMPMVSTMAPNEIVTPPIPFSQLHELDTLVQQLREAGAKGTGDSVLYAFGVHLNPELASTSAPDILRYLRAFLLLHDWMKEAMAIDTTRNLTGFARAFPLDYRRLVIAESYAPSLTQLVADYLHFNPTRNRALDMLPLLSHLDGQQVQAVVDDSLIKSRPTFHFRLPNCHVDRAGWTLETAWTYWLEVEALAWDDARMQRMQKAWTHHHASAFSRLSDAWIKETEQWLKYDHA